MSRTVRDSKLETRAARDRLKPRARPYYRVIIPGVLHLGYRRRRKGAPGRWLLRRYVGLDAKGVGRYRSREIGIADDFEDANGVSVFDYGQAQRYALAWHPGTDPLATRNGPLTVADAVARYITNLHNEGRPTADPEGRARVHILPVLGSLLVEDLTQERLQAWLRDVAHMPGQVRRKRDVVAPKFKLIPETSETKRRRQSTANRTLNVLKAILNFAFDAGLVGDNAAWGRRLKPFRQVDHARQRYLTVAEAKRLLNACDPEFRNLVQAALQTGCRIGELTRLRVHDFHSDSGTVAVHRSKSGKPRHVILTDEGTKFFRQLCAGRPGDEPMLRKPNGETWKKSEQSRPMAAAVERAKISPPISFHGLRHSWASLAVMGGMPLQVVARNLGHADTRMVEKHYGHLEDSYIRRAVQETGPRFGLATGKVVPLAKGR